ncbi:PREDICTED: hypoxia-inducible factor 1-alpha-like [Amphimedon queenslandica]|uniref:PAS domain-containing protein n=1 Tax=Amphimedon queenslandica TaxID=400682 RepID=A0A1X7V3T1_AMPQE|nr:PREDICTED: hypoxia-inducible factor 1-alpha-like [Amphimedon queenslandica]|eukprot:XP_011403284.1 PREDICTED: hypoxia-inducible factor 1-alpha-like [Amphimedon queenslandica]
MEPSNRFDTTEPYSVLNRKERSRELAQKRRTTYKGLMKDLADELPFSKDVVSQVDYNSRLRLALCFFRMKSIAPQKEPLSSESQSVSYHRGLVQDLITESLDGFLMVTGGDGSLIFISESIHKHLGLFQSEHIGLSMYEIIHEEDYETVKSALDDANKKVIDHPGKSAPCSFFCRMKCSRFKVSNTAAKCPGYKLVFVSGHYKITQSEPCLFAIVRPVSPPSILEITMEGNVFVTHYSMQMKCIFFDGRLQNLMGYEKKDLINHVPFEFHHHEDVEANLECSRGLMEKGEGLSGYYRYLTKYGTFVWVQSRATMMFDSRTGKPSYIVCMNYIISREKGEKCLEMRKSKAEAGVPTSPTPSVESSRSHDPFPVPRDDGKSMDPFQDPEAVESTRSPSSVTESLTSAPPLLRSVSPESLQSSSPTPPLSNASDKSSSVLSISDRGYDVMSTTRDSVTTPTAVSPTPSFAESGITTDYGTYSPQISEEGFIKHELLSPTFTKSPPSLVSLLSSEPFDNVKLFQHSPSAIPDVSPISSGYSGQSQIPSDKMSSSFLSRPGQMMQSQGQNVMMSRHPLPSFPPPPPPHAAAGLQYGSMSGNYRHQQVPFNFTATMVQQAPSHLNMSGPYVTAAIPHHYPSPVPSAIPIGVGNGFSLPVLRAEDVQFLNLTSDSYI